MSAAQRGYEVGYGKPPAGRSLQKRQSATRAARAEVPSALLVGVERVGVCQRRRSAAQDHQAGGVEPYQFAIIGLHATQTLIGHPDHPEAIELYTEDSRNAGNPLPDRGGQGVSSSQRPIRRIAMLELIETIAAASGSIPEKRRLDARTFEKPRDPSLDPRIQLDLRAVDEERNFPDTDSTQTKGSPILPATVDQSHGLDESRWSSLLSS
jgi:hypothetical protein